MKCSRPDSCFWYLLSCDGEKVLCHLITTLIFVSPNKQALPPVTRGVPSTLTFRLDNSMPRESQSLKEGLVRKRDWGRLSQQIRCVCITTTISMALTLRSAKRVDFVSVGLLAQRSGPLKFERRQVLPLTIETCKLVHSKVSSSSLFSSQVQLCAFQKIYEEHLFIGRNY